MFLISNLRIKKFPIDEIKPDGWPVQLPSLSGRQAFPIIEESILSQTLTDPCHRDLRGELLLQPLFAMWQDQWEMVARPTAKLHQQAPLPESRIVAAVTKTP